MIHSNCLIVSSFCRRYIINVIITSCSILNNFLFAIDKIHLTTSELRHIPCLAHLYIARPISTLKPLKTAGTQTHYVLGNTTQHLKSLLLADPLSSHSCSMMQAAISAITASKCQLPSVCVQVFCFYVLLFQGRAK